MTIARVIANRNAPSIITTSADVPVHEVITLLANNRIGAVPVLEGDKLVGIFSERDVVYCIAKEGAAALTRPVGELMTGDPVTVSPDTAVLAALQLITERRFRHLPVTENERFVSFISIGDLVKYRLEKVEEEAEAMRNYIQAV